MKTKLFTGGAVVLALTLSGCAVADAGEPGGPAGPEGSAIEGAFDASGIKAVEELAAAVPAEMRERGTFNIGATTSTVPTQYVNEDGDLLGAAIDLFRAVSAVLDLELKFETVTLDALQPGLESNRYDSANMADLPARHERLDFIDTYQNGASIMAHSDYKGDEIDIDTELCGHDVGAVKGSGAERELLKRSEACAAAGNPEIEISSYSDIAAVILAVSSKQNELAMIETVVSLAAAAKDPDRLKVIYTNYLFLTGIAINKGDDELLDAVLGALEHLRETGDYEAIFTHYGVEDAILPEFTVNGGA